MKVNVLNEQLAQALAIVGRAVPKRTTLPILEHFLLTANAETGRLTLAANNLAWCCVHTLHTEVVVAGCGAVPAGRFAEWMKSLPAGDRSELAGDAATQTIKVTGAATASAKFRGLNPQEFPLLPNPADGGDTCEVDAIALRAALAKVTFAASSDESHPTLTGVLLQIEGDTLTLVGADGFRLSEARIPLITPATTPFQVLVPAAMLREMERLPWSSATVTIAVNLLRTQVGFDLGATQIVSQVLTGNYPDYRRIIPSNDTLPVTATLQRVELLAAVKRAAIFARDASDMVRLDVLESVVRVAATSATTGEGTTEVPGTVTGGDLEIAFNARFLSDVLTALDADQVRVRFSHSNRPGVFDTGAPGFVHIIMPMHLGSK